MEGILGLIRTAFDLFKHVVDNSPAPLWPILTGIAFSMAFTQFVKANAPLGIVAKLSPRNRDAATRLFALVSGLVPTWMLWESPYALFWGFTAGIASPVLWKYVVVPVAGYWSPLRRLKLSGDPTNDTDKAGA